MLGHRLTNWLSVRMIWLCFVSSFTASRLPPWPLSQAQHVEQVKTSYASHVLTVEAAEKLTEIAKEGDVFGRLSRSIAPEIFGMEDVKKVRGRLCMWMGVSGKGRWELCVENVHTII